MAMMEIKDINTPTHTHDNNTITIFSFHEVSFRFLVGGNICMQKVESIIRVWC